MNYLNSCCDMLSQKTRGRTPLQTNTTVFKKRNFQSWNAKNRVPGRKKKNEKTTFCPETDFLWALEKNVKVAILPLGACYPVLAKYAGHTGHVRQTSADVRQGSSTLPDILSGRVQYTENVLQMSDIKHDIYWSLTEENVNQMSGRALKACQTFCPADLK